MYDEADIVTSKEIDALRQAVIGFESVVRRWLLDVHPDLVPQELPLG